MYGLSDTKPSKLLNVDWLMKNIAVARIEKVRMIGALYLILNAIINEFQNQLQLQLQFFNLPKANFLYWVVVENL